MRAIADALQTELDVSLASAPSDLQEGIRAGLIDNDRTPRCNPSELASAMGKML